MGLVWLLVFLAAAEVTLAAMASLWSSVSATERERELRFRLMAYGRALGRYRAVYRRGPHSLEDLVRNPRRIKFIQRLYRDPMAGGPGTFEPFKGPDGTIAGVASRAPGLARNDSAYHRWSCDFRGRLQDGTAPDTARASPGTQTDQTAEHAESAERRTGTLDCGEVLSASSAFSAVKKTSQLAMMSTRSSTEGQAGLEAGRAGHPSVPALTRQTNHAEFPLHRPSPSGGGLAGGQPGRLRTFAEEGRQ